jgi:hypothetical protein
VCAGCASQAVAIVTVELDEDDVPQADAGDLIQIIPDGAPADAGLPVSADDVLDMHRVLRDFAGDAADLLARLDTGSQT